MAEKRYPDFYLRKQQRDSRYRRISSIAVGCVLVAAVGGLLGYLGYKYVLVPGQRAGMTAADLAEEKRELEQEQLLAEGSDAQAVGGGPAAGEVQEGNDGLAQDLGEIEYGQSMAGVHVEVEGSGSDATVSGDSAAEGEAVGGGDGDEGDGAGSEAEASPTPPEQREHDEASEGPGGSEEVVTPAVHERQEPAETAEPSGPAAGGGADGEAEGGGSSGTGAGGLVFKVYAGSFSSREDAEKVKDDLLALGFKGSIVDLEIDYLVHVATLDSFDAAEAMKGKLVASGFSSAFATRKRQ